MICKIKNLSTLDKSSIKILLFQGVKIYEIVYKCFKKKYYAL